jgi:hypothetical protein
VKENARIQLPVLKAQAPIPYWQILKNFVGSDMTEVYMPVSMNEPLSALQRIAEMMCICYPHFTKAAEHPDSMMRLAYSLTGLLACCNIARTRKRKPFDSMIGETYEFVTDKMKFVAE